MKSDTDHVCVDRLVGFPRQPQGAMMMSLSQRHSLAVAGVIAASFVALTSSARAAYILTIQPDGLGDIISTGSGTINVLALTLIGSEGLQPGIWGTYNTGSLEYTGHAANADVYYGVGNGGRFGTNGQEPATSGTGDMVGIGEGYGVLVPAGYTSGAALSDSDLFANATLSSLGLTPGTYTSTWGTGPTADSFTVDITNTSVPEPTTIGLLSALGLGLLTRRRQRSSAVHV